MKLVTDRKEIRYLQMPPQSEALRIHFKQFHVVETMNESLNLSISYRGEVGSFGVSTTKGIGFVKGKRSDGRFSICDIFWNNISGQVQIKKNCKRISARSTSLIERRMVKV